MLTTKEISKLSGGTVICNNTVSFNASVRCDGKGTVVISDSVSIGFAKAPRRCNCSWFGSF